MRVALTMWVSMMMVGAVAACDGAVSERAATIGALEGDSAAGAALYETHCQGCHGDDARSGSAGENLVDEVREEEGEFIDTILRGKENGAMPAFDETLSDQEIADILAHLADLAES
jgi:mono/diheme cytochrome c family protein